jgi:hypothetical protein
MPQSGNVIRSIFFNLCNRPGQRSASLQPLFPTQKEYPLPIKKESTWLPSRFEEEINPFPLLRFTTKTFQSAGESLYYVITSLAQLKVVYTTPK